MSGRRVCAAHEAMRTPCAQWWWVPTPDVCRTRCATQWRSQFCTACMQWTNERMHAMMWLPPGMHGLGERFAAKRMRHAATMARRGSSTRRTMPVATLGHLLLSTCSLGKVILSSWGLATRQRLAFLVHAGHVLGVRLVPARYMNA
jgi:hypothetical protein